MPGCKLRKVNPVPLLLILLMLGQPCPDALICDVDQLVHDLTLLIIGGTPPQRNVREEDLLSLAVLLVLVSSLTPVKVDPGASAMAAGGAATTTQPGSAMPCLRWRNDKWQRG